MKDWHQEQTLGLGLTLLGLLGVLFCLWGETNGGMWFDLTGKNFLYCVYAEVICGLSPYVVPIGLVSLGLITVGLYVLYHPTIGGKVNE